MNVSAARSLTESAILKKPAFKPTFALSQRIFLTLVLALSNVFSYSQSYKKTNRTKIYAEESGDSIIIRADNDMVIPVTLRLLFEVENPVPHSVDTVLSIVDPKTTGKILKVLYPENPNGRYKYNYSWRVVPGDVTQSVNADYFYRFPYDKNAGYKVSQGPFGSFSHQKMYAYDFLMPVGTAVCAARDGIVAAIKNDSDKGGSDRKFINEANYISIYHDDGTMANYCHLGKKGIKVKEGQKIKQGQVIALSGNTGFSNGPHLHFEVIKPNINTDLKQWVKFRWESATSRPDLVLNY